MHLTEYYDELGELNGVREEGTKEGRKERVCREKEKARASEG